MLEGYQAGRDRMVQPQAQRILRKRRYHNASTKRNIGVAGRATPRLRPDTPVPLCCNALKADTDDAGLDRDDRLLLYNASVVGFIELLECFALELSNGHLTEHLGIALACDGTFNNFAGHNLSQGLFPL
jgi:hypothetical protein